MAATKKSAATKKAIRTNRPRVAGSIADQINSLVLGGSLSTSERFGIGNASHSDSLLESLKRQRNGLAAYVARVTEELDMREFKVEGGTFITDDKSAILCTAVVTRVG